MQKKFTKEGYNKLKKELDYLKNVKTKEITKQLKHAASFGDFSENAAYDQAKEAKAFLRGRILELEQALTNAKIIEKHSSDIIEIGSIVTVSANNEEEKIQLVSAQEADPFEGKISLESPLGKELQNKRVGDTATIITPTSSTISYKILKIE